MRQVRLPRRAAASEKPKEPGEGEPARPGPGPHQRERAPRGRQAVGLLREGIDAASDDDGWAHLGGVGSLVTKQAPDFDSRNWGYAKLVDLVAAIELFEVTRAAGKGVRVRAKPKGEAAQKTTAKKTSAARKGTAREVLSPAQRRPSTK